MLLGTLQAFESKPQTIRLARWVGYADVTWVQSGHTHTHTHTHDTGHGLAVTKSCMS